jgi:hypothetical protein
MNPEYLQPFSDFAELEALLNQMPFKNMRHRFKHLAANRAETFGIIKNRITRQHAISAISLKRPDVYSKLVEIGNKICPFEFSTIHVNRNVVTPRHKDSLVNRSPSVIVSFGDYEGGELIVEDVVYNCKNHPLVFDGRLLFHWNNPIHSGTKYSLVFYNVIA